MKCFLALAALLAGALAHAQAPPTILQVSWSDPIYPGAQVFIGGSGFTGTTQVRIGPASDAAFTIDSDTNIRAIVPIDAVPGGPISIITGVGQASYATPIVVLKYVPGPGPKCLPNTGNTHTIFNPSTGNTIVALWCDVPTGTFHYTAAGSATLQNFTQANCLAGAPPFAISLDWLQAAWNACLNGIMVPSDEAYGWRVSYFWTPRPTIKGTGPQPIYTQASNGGLGSPLILGTPQAFQTIAGGTTVGGLRIPGGNVTRYCDVSAFKSDQGNVIPAGSYAPCTLIFPPTGGFKLPTSADKATITAMTEQILVDGTAAHHVWGIDAKSIITVDGIEDSTSASVVQLAYVGGLIWQRNVNNLWWSKTDPSAAWLPAGGTATSPLQ